GRANDRLRAGAVAIGVGRQPHAPEPDAQLVRLQPAHLSWHSPSVETQTSTSSTSSVSPATEFMPSARPVCDSNASCACVAPLLCASTLMVRGTRVQLAPPPGAL